MTTGNSTFNVKVTVNFFGSISGIYENSLTVQLSGLTCKINRKRSEIMTRNNHELCSFIALQFSNSNHDDTTITIK